jgi:hypothetical protein
MSTDHGELASYLLVDFLNGEAAKIERDFGGSLRLSARGLDLRKRLPTERAETRGGQ